MGRRIDYHHDPDAPAANSIVPSVNVAVTNDTGEVLLIRDRLLGARHLHATGVFPAISATALATARRSLELMREAGRTISFDPNLRPTLWATPEEMRREINALAFRADWVLPGLEEGRFLTGASTPEGIAAFYRERLYPTILRAVERAPSTLRGWGRSDVDPKALILGIFGAHFMLALDRHFRGEARLEDLVPSIADLVVYGVVDRPASTPAG